MGGNISTTETDRTIEPINYTTKDDGPGLFELMDLGELDGIGGQKWLDEPSTEKWINFTKTTVDSTHCTRNETSTQSNTPVP